MAAFDGCGRSMGLLESYIGVCDGAFSLDNLILKLCLVCEASDAALPLKGTSFDRKPSLRLNKSSFRRIPKEGVRLPYPLAYSLFSSLRDGIELLDLCQDDLPTWGASSRVKEPSFLEDDPFETCEEAAFVWGCVPPRAGSSHR